MLSSHSNLILAYARLNPGKPILWKYLDRVPEEDEKAQAREVLSRLARIAGNS